MKKFLLLILVLVVAAVGIGYMQLGTIVKTGVETAGPKTLKVPVRLQSVSMSPLSGDVTVKGLEIGQPEGFGEGVLASVASFDMKVEPKTLFSDHIVIDHIVIDAPMLDARRLNGKTNFEKLQDNIGPSAPSENPITLTIRKLVVKAPKVAIKNEGMMDVDQTISMADFTITDLGTDEAGLAPSEVARHIMAVLQPQIAKALISAGASEKLQDMAKGAEGKLQEKLGDILGKKKKNTTDDQN